MTAPSRRDAIIGAGPAGAAAAAHLARDGHRVTLIEARAFPRTKVCGEYVSPAGTAALESVLTPGELLAIGARRVDLFALDERGRCVEWRTPKPAWALSRRSLDAALVDRARALGANIRQPASVRAVSYEPSGASVVLADGGEIAVDAVIHADGTGRHDPAGPTPVDPALIGHKCHLRVPGGVRGVRIRAAAGAYVGTIEVEDGLATCALVARRRLIARFDGDADAMLAELWPGYEPAWREGSWLACGVARSAYREPGDARSVRLGNAAAAVDPVGGEGIGNALWSAATFARALRETGDLAAAKATLARAYRRRLRTRLPACRAAGRLLMRPGLIRAIWPLLSTRRPGSAMMLAWYRLSGKPKAAGFEG